jgi:hypothetical protein
MQPSSTATALTYRPTRDLSWVWLLPLVGCVLLVVGALQVRDCALGLSACHRHGNNFFTGLGMLAAGVLFTSIAVRELRVWTGLGAVSLQAGNAITAGESVAVVAFVERGVPEKSAVFFELFRHDKIGGTAKQSKLVCARAEARVELIDGQLQAKATLLVPSDLRVVRGESGVVAQVTIHVESVVGGLLWRGLLGGKRSWRTAIPDLRDGFAFFWTGPIGFNHDFALPWQAQADEGAAPTSAASAGQTAAATALNASSTWQRVGKIDMAGTLSNGLACRTRNKANIWDSEGDVPGQFLWEVHGVPAAKLAELHLMPRQHFDSAMQQLESVRASAALMHQGAPVAGANFIERASMGLNVVMLEALKNTERDNTSPFWLCSREELTACDAGGVAFAEVFAVLSNDGGLAWHLFGDARISAAMVSVAENEVQRMTLKLQDNSMSVSIKSCNFGAAVAEHWVPISIALAERCLTFRARPTA